MRTMWLIRETHKMKSAAPINIPVAVSFSKIDELTGVIDPLVLQASQHNGYLDAADTETVHEVLASHLEKWEAAISAVPWKAISKLIPFLDYRRWDPALRTAKSSAGSVLFGLKIRCYGYCIKKALSGPTESEGGMYGIRAGVLYIDGSRIEGHEGIPDESRQFRA